MSVGVQESTGEVTFLLFFWVFLFLTNIGKSTNCIQFAESILAILYECEQPRKCDADQISEYSLFCCGILKTCRMFMAKFMTLIRIRGCKCICVLSYIEINFIFVNLTDV